MLNLQGKTILVLYAEVLGYTLSWLEALAREGADVQVVAWDKGKLNPFTPSSDKITLTNRSQYDDAGLKALIDRVKPDLILLSGWMDDGYMKAGRYARSKDLKVITISDAQWRGLPRQWANVLFRWRVRSTANYIWVPGPYQYEYARRLGYKRENVLLYCYSADTTRFAAAWQERKEIVAKDQQFTILFAGRLAPVKNLDMLTSVFIELTKEIDPRWKLRIVGSGPIRDTLPVHDQIEYVPFVEPNKVPELTKEIAFYCLPSKFDAFPLALHEFTSAGVPILASDICGDVPVLVANGYNGYAFHNLDRDDLKRRLKQMCSASKEEIAVMSARSHELSHLLGINAWLAQIYRILNA